MKIGIGVVIGIILIVYWWMQDHPSAPTPVKQGQEHHFISAG